MNRFAVIAATTLALAAPASALTINLPDLAFPTSSTVISTQNCFAVPGGTTPCK